MAIDIKTKRDMVFPRWRPYITPVESARAARKIFD
jgi:hypothetical protein